MGRQTVRVLVVDDECIQLMLVANAFRRFNEDVSNSYFVVVDVANSVDNAMKFIDSQMEYDFIISDIEMPIKTGFDFFQELKNKNYPASVIANSYRPDYKDKCLAVGFFDFHDKLYGEKNLFDIICNAVVCRVSA